ncbi:N-acetylglucosamine-6-phosphate deacetylase [Halobacillus sp. MO56]
MPRTLMMKNIQIIVDNNQVITGSLWIENGKISTVTEGDLSDRKADVVIDGKGKHWTVLPGFIDVHIHGAAGHDTMDATPEALTGIAEALPQEGTTSFLATTMTQSHQAISKALKNAAGYIKEQTAGAGAEVIGIHLEGPFISKDKAGAQPLDHIIAPDIPQFDQWQQESNGLIRLVTIAPEEPGALQLIRHLHESGIVASIGHTNATYQEVTDAVEHGASHVTHLYNQMRGLHHREPGALGAALLHKELTTEIIVDLVHAHRDAVRLAYQSKGPERMILITDAMRAKCLPEGNYDLAGQEVTVKNNEARLDDGTLAGSILTLKQAVANMKEIVAPSWLDIIRLTSENAARELGVFDRKGSISTGKDADLVILDEDFDVAMTICNGYVAYEREG